MVQGGSALQYLQGIGASQLKVSAETSKAAGSSFGDLLNLKSQAVNMRTADDTSSNNTQFNNQELTKHDSKLVQENMKKSKSVETSESPEVKENDTVNSKSEEAKTERVSEGKDGDREQLETKVKELLKKLGLSDSEIEKVLDEMPEDVIAQFQVLFESLPVSEEILAQGLTQEDMTKWVAQAESVIQTLIGELSGVDNVSGEVLAGLEVIQDKLETALENLSKMPQSEFDKMLSEIVMMDEKNSKEEAGTPIEVVEVSVQRNTAESGNESIEVSSDTDDLEDSNPLLKTQTENTSDSDQKQNAPSEGGNEKPDLVQSAESSTEQINRSYEELVRVENNVVQNTKAVETTAARTQLAENIMNQVMQGAKVNIHSDQESQQILLKLRPEELGNVNLKLSIEKGILMAEFQVESQVVKATLESNMGDLKQALSEKGYSIEGMQVSVGQDQTESREQKNSMFFNQAVKRKYFFGSEEENADFESINKTLAGLQSTFEYLG